MRQYKLRKAIESDLIQAYKLAVQYDPSVKFEVFEDNWLITINHSEVWVLEDEDETLVGIIAYLVGKGQFDGKPYIQKLHWFVDQGKRGVGMRLLRKMEDHAKELGIEDVRIYLPKDFKPLRGYEAVEILYRKTNGN